MFAKAEGLLVILTQWQKPRINNCMLSALSLLSPTLTRHDHGGSSTSTTMGCPHPFNGRRASSSSADYEDNQAHDFVPTRPPFKVASFFGCVFPRALSRSYSANGSHLIAKKIQRNTGTGLEGWIPLLALSPAAYSIYCQEGLDPNFNNGRLMMRLALRSYDFCPVCSIEHPESGRQNCGEQAPSFRKWNQRQSRELGPKTQRRKTLRCWQRAGRPRFGGVRDMLLVARAKPKAATSVDPRDCTAGPWAPRI
ncbi:hypothetical protein V8E53_014656, partial [Lactarius tabidus]